MPKLENPKHESFALNIAKGMKQGEAYVHAGYSANASAASRLASSPYIVDRITQLEKEIMAKMNEVMTRPSTEAAESLAELGLTMDWVARAYQTIYTEALDAKSFAAANSAVASIQKLIEIENTGNPEPEANANQLVNLNDVTGLVKELKALAELGQNEGTDFEPEMVDVTPALSPADILAVKGADDDPDNQ